MSKIHFSLLCLFVCLLARAATLQHPALSDPTEARYAFIAQEMVLSGDWIVPKIPWKGVFEPYLGKPPLHFWLTAASFELLGMEEWAARLPSFFALLLMCASLLYMRRSPELQGSAVCATVILASSGLIFFMSGASVVDVTLSGFIALACTTGYTCITDPEKRYRAGALFALALGFAFLTKGPIALAIVGLPAFSWLVFTKRLSLLSRPPWLLCICIFLVTTVPWFVAAQARNPDFLRYFFVNENLNRYLLSDYGDRYGSGHHYPYGMIWLVALAGFLPWSLVLLAALWTIRRRIVLGSFWSERPALVFFGLWGISPLVIFTFAKQIHPGYILPGIPGLAVCAALLLHEAPRSWLRLLYGTLSVIVVAAPPVIGIYQSYFGTTPLSLLLLLPSLFGIVWVTYRMIHGKLDELLLGVATATAFASTTWLLADDISRQVSTKTILECISAHSHHTQPTVGVVDANTYSLYFYSRALGNDAKRPIVVHYLSSDSLPARLPDDILLRTKDLGEVKKNLPSAYQLQSSLGRWTWLRRSQISITPLLCP